MKTRTTAAVLVALVSVHAGGCTSGAFNAPAAASFAIRDEIPRDLERFIRLYSADRTSVQRFHSLPWCEERFDRVAALTSTWRGKLKEVDFASLDQHGKVDYTLMETELDAEDAGVAMGRRQLAEMDAALPFRRAVLDLELSRRRMEPVDSQAAAAALGNIPGLLGDLRKNIRELKDESPANAIRLSPVVARRTAGAAEALRRTLTSWFEYHDGFKPEFAWWVRKPYREAVEAIDSYAKYLREDIAGIKGRDDDPLIGDPIGAEGLASDLASEMMVYTPQELIAIGEQEFAWCEAEMRRAANEMGFGDDWKAALEKVKNDHVAPGEQDALVRQQSIDAIDFVTDRDLVTVPELCMETWRLEMLSTQTQKTLPFAVYGGQYMGVAYATEEMKHDDKHMSMRGNNIHFSRIVTPHELIPGHHLQGYQAQRLRPYRSLFNTPFYVEGWAVYWEMTLWDLGYPQSPENRVGMLFWRMHRCARVIVSLKFHLGEMTPEQMIDFLVDRVGHEKFGATSEVRRYIGGDYSPLYQCAYMIGALQLRALYQELVESGKMTAKEFNDGVLGCNSIPIKAIRAELAGTEVQPGWKPAWRFGGE